MPATASADTTSKYQNLHKVVRESTTIVPEIQGVDESDANQILCLALNIYQEVRSGAPRDRWAVGFVTLNRLKRGIWGSSICAVVWAKSQFSWTARSIGTLVPSEASAWADAQNKAYLLYREQYTDDPTQGATHFYLAKIHPGWASKLVARMRIGAHMFARLPGISTLPVVAKIPIVTASSKF